MNRKPDSRSRKSRRSTSSGDRTRGSSGGRARDSSGGPSGGRASAGRGLSPDPASSSGGGKPVKAHVGKLRIIGGDFRGRTIRYHGSTFTRPMKDSVRENLFNILGPAIRGTSCFDLFAGTGAIAFESLSRGAASAVAVETSRYAARYIRESAEKLGVERRFRLLTGDAFRLADRLLGPPRDDTPWSVFLCPPYRMWDDPEDLESLRRIIRLTFEHAPPGSLLAAETEKRFDPELLPAGDWDLREYGDTRLAIAEPPRRCGMNL